MSDAELLRQADALAYLRHYSGADPFLHSLKALSHLTPKQTEAALGARDATAVKARLADYDGSNRFLLDMKAKPFLTARQADAALRVLAEDASR
jgi:hypothetical protein